MPSEHLNLSVSRTKCKTEFRKRLFNEIKSICDHRDIINAVIVGSYSQCNERYWVKEGDLISLSDCEAVVVCKDGRSSEIHHRIRGLAKSRDFSGCINSVPVDLYVLESRKVKTLPKYLRHWEAATFGVGLLGNENGMPIFELKDIRISELNEYFIWQSKKLCGLFCLLRKCRNREGSKFDVYRLNSESFKCLVNLIKVLQVRGGEYCVSDLEKVGRALADTNKYSECLDQRDIELCSTFINGGHVNEQEMFFTACKGWVSYFERFVRPNWACRRWTDLHIFRHVSQVPMRDQAWSLRHGPMNAIARRYAHEILSILSDESHQ